MIKYSQLNYNYNSMDVTIIIRVIKNQSCNLSFLLSQLKCVCVNKTKMIRRYIDLVRRESGFRSGFSEMQRKNHKMQRCEGSKILTDADQVEK